MKVLRIILAVSVVSCFMGCACMKCMKCKCMCMQDETVQLSAIPKVVTDAAAATVKGFVATQAKVEKEKGGTVYELEGKADGQEYEMEITAEGKVIRFKLEEEEKGEHRD